MKASESPDALRFGIAALTCAAIAVALVLFAVIASLPVNPVTPSWSPQVRVALVQLLPEKWGFFTKSQRDDYFELYTRRNGAWAYSFDGPQSAPANLFGVRRTARAQGIEIGALEGTLAAKQLRSCDDEFDVCTKGLKRITIESKFADPLVCGDTLLVIRTPVPWNWATFSHVTMNARYARVNIRCK